MILRRVLLLACAALVLSSCGLAREMELKKANIELAEKVQQSRDECASKRQSGQLKSEVDFAKCMNEAERPLLERSGDYADLTNVLFAARIEIAEKVDNKKISKAESDLELAELRSKLVSELKSRGLAERSVFAQESAAYRPNVAVQNKPFHCTTIGNTTSCY